MQHSHSNHHEVVRSYKRPTTYINLHYLSSHMILSHFLYQLFCGRLVSVIDLEEAVCSCLLQRETLAW